MTDDISDLKVLANKKAILDVRMTDDISDLKILAKKKAIRNTKREKAKNSKASVEDKLDYIIALLE